MCGESGNLGKQVLYFREGLPAYENFELAKGYSNFRFVLIVFSNVQEGERYWRERREGMGRSILN